ncbi:PREDICTED: RAD9, HUS1, RAD1-interacting nuclear orphan protein 1 [Ficedula albicollis]|uniref:RAD9, HUS1, RAD1-interacting nuclear orphan protein 1 n=1 Tax=Ficedula albicollis TaxID=59894 RepID=UPI000392057B|nr:PREDICTED: RAD9, HUS1, RAD1-interacting nuclear orphan protein 1 [Ficedula albicollis]XP_016160486.1 PREDICTED: RAD9, HUS1, RAD1-interacting nuclear orphan protein 1 [Ficedula albicollis]
MPPKKKCTHKARKAELVFLERPRAGPIHCYETPLRSAENPRRVPTKPVDRNTSAVWVCPQFDTTKSVVLKACRKKHRGPHKPYNQNANHSSFHAGGACRFPPLTFENPEGHEFPPLDDPNRSRKNAQCSHNQPKKGTAANANFQVKSPENCGEPAPQPVEQEVLCPPDAEATQVPPPRNVGCSDTPPQSSHAWHPENELALGTDPCGRGEAAAVLVTDTPEHEYGVKVTWRRRPHIMKYLREQGKLSAADILVKANTELWRGQADS